VPIVPAIILTAKRYIERGTTLFKSVEGLGTGDWRKHRTEQIKCSCETVGVDRVGWIFENYSCMLALIKI
jgi:hypothetical protein